VREIDFKALIEPVARRLFGDPNSHRSSRKELRFGSNGSLSIDLEKGTFYDHEEKVGGGLLDLIEYRTGYAKTRAIEWLIENHLLQKEVPMQVKPSRKIVATYDYTDELGELLFQVVRFEPKDFRQRRPPRKDDVSGGEWVWNVDGVRKVPYRLPQVMEAIANGHTIFIPEGEKDVDALWRLNLPATCNAMGAGNWPDNISEHFRDADVVFLPDNDDAGRDHVAVVAAALSGIAARMRSLQLPDLGHKEDVSDWIERGGTTEALNAMLDQARPVDDFLKSSTALPRGGDHSTEKWPQSLGDDAYYGIVGDIVHAIEPETEADPVAILLQLVSAFGNLCGRSCYYKVEGDRHPAIIWHILVGATSKARKGTSWGRVLEVIAPIDPVWTGSRIQTGLSSGEGLVHQVRNERQAKDGAVEDRGVQDKRLLIMESEFASPLRNMERQGNTLSPTLRTMWDTGSSNTLTKNAPETASGATVTVVGHITQEELRRTLTKTEMANGLANRFLFALVRRSKALPYGGKDVDLSSFVDHLKEARARAWQSDQRFNWTAEAAAVWESVYLELSEGKPGLLGAITSRAEAQVVRLALAYALLDKASAIDVPHLKAALAVWKYCEESARIIFGDRTGNDLADDVLQKLRTFTNGMTRTEISKSLSKHQSAESIAAALKQLADQGLVRFEERRTGGRPEERWFANN
jgi:hypothetical protein